jgi:hypothetical protein
MDFNIENLEQTLKKMKSKDDILDYFTNGLGIANDKIIIKANPFSKNININLNLDEYSKFNINLHQVNGVKISFEKKI